MTSGRISLGESSGAAFPPCHSANEMPVASITSSARTIRCGSAGFSLPPLAGSRAAGLHPPSHCRTARGELLVQGLAASLGGSLTPIGAQLGGNIGNWREPLGQNLEIESGAPDQDRQSSLPLRFRQGVSHVIEPASDGTRLRGGDGAIEAVGGAR